MMGITQTIVGYFIEFIERFSINPEMKTVEQPEFQWSFDWFCEQSANAHAIVLEFGTYRFPIFPIFFPFSYEFL